MYMYNSSAILYYSTIWTIKLDNSLVGIEPYEKACYLFILILICLVL